jgi:hypothetical protein
MNVIDYVREEVTRQGHDVETLDGIERVGWMLDAWSYALVLSHEWPRPSMVESITLGKMVERRKNKKGIRSCGVRVGLRVCPPADEVQDRLELLFAHGDDLSPIEFYKEFEMIHPFVDGNGRTGKILLNWKNGTLLDPIFPPSDLFGYAIRNP